MFDAVDWNAMFAFDTPLLEILVRGTIMYLGLFLMLRFVLNRQSGGVSITDVLLIVLIADAAQNGMAGDYESISSGLLLVATIVFWDYALDWLGFHSLFMNRFLNPKEVCLIRNGRMLKANMKQEMITEDELRGQLREKGVDSITKVKTAMIESGGELSVITYETSRPKATKNQKKSTPGAD